MLISTVSHSSESHRLVEITPFQLVAQVRGWRNVWSSSFVVNIAGDCRVNPCYNLIPVLLALAWSDSTTFGGFVHSGQPQLCTSTFARFLTASDTTKLWHNHFHIHITHVHAWTQLRQIYHCHGSQYSKPNLRMRMKSKHSTQDLLAPTFPSIPSNTYYTAQNVTRCDVRGVQSKKWCVGTVLAAYSR